MAVINNIYRVATLLRKHVEQTVLIRWNISWTAFVVLNNLWIQGDQESRHLAERIGVSKATLSGIVKTLEKRELCERRPRAHDRRLVEIHLTNAGHELVGEIFPEFNRHETIVTNELTEHERDQLAQGLRTIVRTVEQYPENGSA